MEFRNYSTAEYRKAGIGGGPFALEGNPDPEKRNYRTNRDRSPHGILGGVMHITVGMSDYTLPDVSAEGTTRYGMDTTRDASWHVCVDSDGIIPSIRDAYTAWHAGVPDIPGVNDATLGMEIGTGSTDWRKKPDAWVKATIRNAAVWWAPRVIKHGIPLRLESSRTAIAAAIPAGKKFGFTSHKVIAPSNRTDPGWVDTNANGTADTDTFPWSLFFQYVREEIAILGGTAPTTQEDPMANQFDKADAHDLFAGFAICDNTIASTPNPVAPSYLIEGGAKQAKDAATAARAADTKAGQVLTELDAVQKAVTALDGKVTNLTTGGVDLDALAAKVADLLAARLQA